MNKKDFEKFLDAKLVYLVENVKNQEIQKYISVVDNYVNMGQTEEAAISSFGNSEDLVTAIYLSHGLDYKKLSTGGTSFKGFKGALSKFFKIISGSDKKAAWNAVLYFLYLVLLVIIIRIPIILIRDVLSTTFEDLISNGIVNKIYYLVFNIIYVVSAAIVFIKMFTKKFK